MKAGGAVKYLPFFIHCRYAITNSLLLLLLYYVFENNKCVLMIRLVFKFDSVVRSIQSGVKNDSCINSKAKQPGLKLLSPFSNKNALNRVL